MPTRTPGIKGAVPARFLAMGLRWNAHTFLENEATYWTLPLRFISDKPFTFSKEDGEFLYSLGGFYTYGTINGYNVDVLVRVRNPLHRDKMIKRIAFWKEYMMNAQQLLPE